MANAPRDPNQIPAHLGVLNTDGVTTIPIKANPISHALKVSDGTGGSDNGPANAKRDQNQVTSIVATSSVDGKTPVVVYADASGNLLIDSM